MSEGRAPIQSLPPLRGEVRWGVGVRERVCGSRCTPDHLLNRLRRNVAPTPLFVSPLKGGRDEFGSEFLFDDDFLVSPLEGGRDELGDGCGGVGSVNSP